MVYKSLRNILLKPGRKFYQLIRDNWIVTYLNSVGFTSSANFYNWVTTETSDVIILSLATKLGITSVESKYIILVICSFLL